MLDFGLPIFWDGTLEMLKGCAAKGIYVESDVEQPPVIQQIATVEYDWFIHQLLHLDG